MKLFRKIFNREKSEENVPLILSTDLLNITNPSYKQVVEHIKGIFDKDKYIKLTYSMDESDKNPYIKASANKNGKDYDIEYYPGEKDIKYFLQASDVEQTMCFFRDFTEMHKLVDFDLENNDWEKKTKDWRNI